MNTPIHIRKCIYAYKCVLYSAGSESCFEKQEICELYQRRKEVEEQIKLEDARGFGVGAISQEDLERMV